MQAPTEPTTERRSRTRANSPASSKASPLVVVRLFTETYWPARAEEVGPGPIEIPVLALRFEYAGRLVGPERASTDWASTDWASTDWASTEASNRHGVVRDTTGELAAERCLESLGAVDVTCLEDCPLPLGSEADYLVTTQWRPGDVNLHALCSFTAGVTAL